jgi:hypothetical protein
MRLRLVLALTGALWLAACGGGGGGDGSPAPGPARVAPQVTVNPSSQAAAAGLPVTFSVGAIGSGPLAYQWRRDGAPIAGATQSTYTLAATLADDGARFSVTLTNDAGSLTSAEALLTVHPAPAPATSCGGGAAFTVQADATVAAGQAAGATLAGCTTAARDVLWTQTGGPPLDAGANLLAAKTQAISFEPPLAGTYTFRVVFRDDGGAARQADVAVTATAASGASQVVARGDQAVRAGGNVSIRAWPRLAAGDAVQSFRWVQLEGPPVVMQTATIGAPSGPTSRALFRAPEVARDTLLRFRVTLTTSAGTAGDDVWVLVENHPQAPAGSGTHVFEGIHVSRVYPYRGTGSFAAHLARCTYDVALQWTGGGKNLCPLATLPFLHQSTGGAVPTTAQIMDRVLVSHDWIGARFEQFLDSPNASADLKRMFNGVTAIVIGAQVRPSYYYALTGAIYLDADNFWLSAAELDTVNEAPDFRSGFDRDLNYSGLWRYVLNNGNIFQLCAVAGRGGRPSDCLLYDAGWLLYHELGHAADFLPPAERGALNGALSAWDNIAPRFGARNLPSDLLDGTHPLTSAQMRALAQVKFITGPPAGGDAALVNGIAYGTLRGYTPQQVAGFFSADRASDEYAYSTTREDIAMLIEEFMLARNHGIRRDIAITDKVRPTDTGSTVIVRWGSRGRVGEPGLRPRVQFTVERLAPWVLQSDPNAVAALPPPLPMRPGESWTANLLLPAPGVAPQAVRGASLPDDAALLPRALRRPHEGIGEPKLPGER